MLSKRLEGILQVIKNTNKVIDIGTDHGYIPIEIIKRKIAKEAIAVDILEGPLEIARENIQKEKLCDSIQIVKSDGFDRLEIYSKNTVVIAGMGGELICRILEKDKYKILKDTQIILQPMTGAEIVKEYLNKEGFEIVKEYYTNEGRRPYIIINTIKKDLKFNKDSKLNNYICSSKVNDINAYKLFIKKTIKRQKKILYGLKCENKTNEIYKQKKLCEELIKHYENI